MKPYLQIRYCLDWTLALVLLPLCIPFFVLISLVQFFVFGDIVFTQQRSGLKGEVFTLFKFKTMMDDENLTEQERIPSWGKFLRNTGLDELPQILNILSGTMAFIGPRPLLPEYNSLYSSEQKQRLLIKPGITGYAQAYFRNKTSWIQRFEHDVYYVRHASMFLDLKILYRSLLQLLRAKPQDILEKFKGQNP